AAVQWTFNYPAAAIAAISAMAGPAATAAGKTVFCVSGSGSYTCIVSAANSNTISNGVLATVAITVPSAFSGTSVAVNGVSGASASGAALTVSGTGGTIGSSAPPPATL